MEHQFLMNGALTKKGQMLEIIRHTNLFAFVV